MSEWYATAILPFSSADRHGRRRVGVVRDDVSALRHQRTGRVALLARVVPAVHPDHPHLHLGIDRARAQRERVDPLQDLGDREGRHVTELSRLAHPAGHHAREIATFVEAGVVGVDVRRRLVAGRMLELRIWKLLGDLQRRVHEAERGREYQRVALLRKVADHALGIGTLGHLLDEAGLDLVAQRLFQRQSSGVVLRGPARIAHRTDIDECDLERLRLGCFGGLGRARPARPWALQVRACHRPRSRPTQQRRTAARRCDSSSGFSGCDLRSAGEAGRRFYASPIPTPSCQTPPPPLERSTRCPRAPWPVSNGSAMISRPARERASSRRCATSRPRSLPPLRRCDACTKRCASCAPTPTTRPCCARSSRCCAVSPRARDLRAHRAALADSGIAGTATWYPFFYPTARWIAERWPARIAAGPRGHRRRATRSPRSCRRCCRRSRRTGCARRISRVTRRSTPCAARAPTRRSSSSASRRCPAMSFVREAIYDLVNPSCVLRRGAARLHARPPYSRRAPRAWQTGPLRHDRPDLRAEIARPPRSLRRVPAKEGRTLVTLARETMITHQRDLDAFAHGHAADVWLADDGGGLAFALIGMRPERRTTLAAIYGGPDAAKRRADRLPPDRFSRPLRCGVVQHVRDVPRRRVGARAGAPAGRAARVCRRRIVQHRAVSARRWATTRGSSRARGGSISSSASALAHAPRGSSRVQNSNGSAPTRVTVRRQRPCTDSRRITCTSRWTRLNLHHSCC